jgi:hypothetical protein
MPTSRLTNIAIILLLVGIFFNKYIDFNSYLNLPKQNNFLDIRFSFLDLGIVFLTVSGLFKSLKNPLSSWLNLASFTILFLPVLTKFSFPFALESARFWLWIDILPRILTLNKGLVLGLGVASFFDHLLFSSSLPLALAFIYSRFYRLKDIFQKLISSGMSGYLGVNLFAAGSQVLTGQDLGLNLLGEPSLNLVTTGIAKQNFLDQIFLRGYGLTQHPNLLGTAGMMNLFWANNNSSINKLFPKTSRTIRKLQKNLSLATILLSFSRSSWISALIYFWQNNRRYRMQILIGGLFVIGLFVTKIAPDQFRFQDLQNYFEVLKKAGLQQQFFGSGYYPQFLQQNFPNNPVWQWQPVHNFWLSLVAQYGIVGSSIYIFSVVWKSRKALQDLVF